MSEQIEIVVLGNRFWCAKCTHEPYVERQDNPPGIYVFCVNPCCAQFEKRALVPAVKLDVVPICSPSPK